MTFVKNTECPLASHPFPPPPVCSSCCLCGFLWLDWAYASLARMFPRRCCVLRLSHQEAHVVFLSFLGDVNFNNFVKDQGVAQFFDWMIIIFLLLHLIGRYLQDHANILLFIKIFPRFNFHCWFISDLFFTTVTENDFPTPAFPPHLPFGPWLLPLPSLLSPFHHSPTSLL